MTSQTYKNYIFDKTSYLELQKAGNLLDKAKNAAKSAMKMATECAKDPSKCLDNVKQYKECGEKIAVSIVKISESVSKNANKIDINLLIKMSLLAYLNKLNPTNIEIVCENNKKVCSPLIKEFELFTKDPLKKCFDNIIKHLGIDFKLSTNTENPSDKDNIENIMKNADGLINFIKTFVNIAIKVSKVVT